MFFVASKLLAFLINPMFWILWSLLTFIVNPREKWGQKYTWIRFFAFNRKWATIVLVFFLYTAGNSFVMSELLIWWEGDPSEFRIERSADSTKIPSTAIVLGGFSSYDAERNYFQLSNTGDRLMAGVIGLANHRFNHVIISGGSSSIIDKSYLESDRAKIYMSYLNLDTSKIISESASRNTWENAVNCKALLAKMKVHEPVLLITSAMHMPRSLACFKKAGVAVIPYPVNFSSSKRRSYSLSTFLIPSAGALSKSDDLIHEWLGMITYKLSGKN